MKAPVNTKSGNGEHLYIVPVLGRGGYVFVWSKNAAEAVKRAAEREVVCA